MEAGTTITIGLMCTVAGSVITYLTFLKNSKKDTKKETEQDTERNVRFEMKLDHISTNVNEIRLEQKDTSKAINVLSERITKVEESSKQAHKRIDKLEEKEERSEINAK